MFAHFLLISIVGTVGNPGVAGSGSVLYKAGSRADELKKDEMWYGHHYIGEKVTNNVAEYTGLIEGLKQAVEMNVHSILIQGEWETWEKMLMAFSVCNLLD